MRAQLDPAQFRDEISAYMGIFLKLLVSIFELNMSHSSIKVEDLVRTYFCHLFIVFTLNFKTVLEFSCLIFSLEIMSQKVTETLGVIRVT